MLTVKASTNLSITIKAEIDVWCACKKQATRSICWHKYCLCKLEAIIHKHKTNTTYLPILIPYRAAHICSLNLEGFWT